MTGRVIGWKVDREDREALLARIAPRYPDVIADHVTLDATGRAALPDPKTGEIIGEADDGAGVQALVVRIDGGTDRPDGSTWHITWSIDRGRGRQPVESNHVIARLGWHPLDPPEPVRLHPARF